MDARGARAGASAEGTGGRLVRLLTRDLAPALVVAAVVVLGTQALDPDPGERAADAGAYACALVAAGALTLRRHRPVLMVAVVALALGVYVARDYLSGPVHVTGPLALLGLGLVRPRRDAYLAAGAMVTALATARLVTGELELQGRDLTVLGWAVAAVLAADALRGRVERAVAASQQWRDRTARAVAEERLHIAQDLHDSVAHAMVGINVQAGVAAHLAASHPERLGPALEQIRASSAAALDELGSMVDVLRQGAPRTPGPATATLPELVARAREVGLTVTLDQQDVAEHRPEHRPAHLEAAVRRVVQEALTNVLRHAPGATAHVSLRGGPDGEVVVRVHDTGAPRAQHGPAPAAGSGLGLVGMRERVERSGGTLVHGPLVPGPGFGVEARWPGR